MKHLTAALVLFLFIIRSGHTQSTFMSSGGGSGRWNDPATWTLLTGSSSTGYPVAGDTATIGSSASLSVDSNAQCSALTINGGATLTLDSIASILTVSNSLSLSGSASLNLSLGLLTVTGNLSIGSPSTVTVNQGALTVIGLVLINATATAGTGLLDIEGGAFSCAGGMTITATVFPTGRSAELRINNGSVNIAGGLATITANARINFTGPGTMTLAGAISITNTASFIAGNGRVIYFGIPGSNQAVAALTYYRLVITGVGTGVKQISGAVTVTDSLTLLTDTLEINSGGSLNLSNGITLVRTAGRLLSAPMFAGSANLVYNDVGRDSTGAEMPTTTTTLQNLTIADISGIDLSANITVNNTLNLPLGPLWTDSYTLTLANPAGGTTTDPAISRINGYVMGSLIRSIGTTTGLRIFPMGAGTSQYYREFNLDFTTAPTAGGSITVMAADSAAPAQSGLPLTDGSETIVNVAPLYWEADAGNGLSGGAYTLTLTATGIPGVSDLNTLRLIKRPSTGGPWIADGVAGTNSGSTSIPVVVRTGMSGFSQFSIGSDNTNTLPVYLISFTGQTAGNNVTLRWTTAGEVNNEAFTITHSTDAIRFTDLATIPGGGSTDLPKSYSYTELTVPAGANYYRLQQTDLDGNSTYSPIISVKVGDGATPSWSLYPNPAISTLNIQSAVNAPFQLYDNNGKLIRTLVPGANEIGNLSPGLYLVRSQGKSVIFIKN